MWLDGPIPPALARFPGYLMARLGQLSSHAFGQALEPLGLHPRDFGVMNIVANQPGLTQQRLHAQTAIDTSSMVAVIDELERRGLAERRTHPDDRRARAIHLTAEGERVLTEARKLAAKHQAQFFDALTADELRALTELLQKVAVARAAGGPPA